MNENYLRFNQSDGSVSLIVQTGFLANNQLQSINPDPIVIPSLARTCKRKQSDRLLCPIRVPIRIELDYFYLSKAIKIPEKLRFQDGYLILLNLPIGNSQRDTFLF